MLDLNKHKFYLVQILKDIYSDLELANHLGFKGGTAMMLFYDLPRFSVDLDFNLLEVSVSEKVFSGVRKILLKYGRIKDEAQKHYGLLLVLDYGESQRNLKLEISNRQFDDQYEIKNYLGINIKVMTLPDMFAHKLCALTDRKLITNRDVFDCYYFMQNRTPINAGIVRQRTGKDLKDYLESCIKAVGSISDKKILDGLGEVMDEELKRFVRTDLKNETISLIRMYQEMPLVINV